MICELCGHYEATDTHHLLFGWDRMKADEDGLTIKVCRMCHTTAYHVRDRVHDNPRAEDLSKMLGQMMFERNKCAEGMTLDEARNCFMNRYGKSYL